MDVVPNILPVYTEPPSYIREILKSSEKIYLVYEYNVLSPEANENKIKFNVEDSSLDLTGNPLLVDLNIDVSFTVQDEHIWSHEENNHYPIHISNARKIIKKFNKELHSNKIQRSYIYCVCNGADIKCTLVLGAFQSDDYLSRTEIYHEGCFHRSNILFTLEKMVESHRSNTSVSNCQVTSLVVAQYGIYGNNLRKFQISNTFPYSACIFCNVCWDTLQYEVPEYVQSAEMTVQIIIGHKESVMHVFWEQLTLLQIYIDVLMKQPIELQAVILSDNPKKYLEIFEEICNVLEEIQGVRRIVFKKRREDNLDTANLRQADLIDKLWNILVSCNNVGDLKNCFHALFEELASRESFKSIISEENKSTIAVIISEISSGKLAVPTLSPTQALQYLIELGIEKLKNDYFYILNHFDCLNYEKLENYWCKITDAYTTEVKSASNNRITKQSIERNSRRARLTAQPSISLIDTSEKLRKLNCLLKMHTACDFLLMGTKAPLSTQESFAALVESVNEYMFKIDNTVLSKNFADYMLEEIKVNLKSSDVQFLQGKDPISWNIKFTSAYDRSLVTTIFHHSLKPLFPPSIYKDYDLPESDNADSTIYYVTKLVSLTEKI